MLKYTKANWIKQKTFKTITGKGLVVFSIAISFYETYTAENKVSEVDEDRYLIFTTDDVIYEEFLTVTLISINDGVLESLQLGNEYSSSFFEKLSTSHESVHFHCIGDAVWTIKVADLPRLRLPFFSDPLGVKRISGLQTYIKIVAETILTATKK